MIFRITEEFEEKVKQQEVEMVENVEKVKSTGPPGQREANDETKPLCSPGSGNNRCCKEECDGGGMFWKTRGGALKNTCAVGLNMTKELSIVVLHIASVWTKKNQWRLQRLHEDLHLSGCSLTSA